MALPDDGDRKVSDGEFFSVEFAVKSSSRMASAWSWMQEVDERTLMAFMRLFDRVAETGIIHDETVLKRLDGDVWEFKRPGTRVLCVRHGNRFLLTNVLKKSGRKNISSDIASAKSIGEEHLKWEASRIQKLKNH